MLADKTKQSRHQGDRIIQSQMWSILFLLCISLQFTSVASGFFFRPDENDGHTDWSYDRQSEWVKSGQQCNQSSQSPVNIDQARVRFNHQLKLHFFNYDRPTRFKIQNAHHTIKLNPIATYPSGSKLDGDESGETESSMIKFLAQDYPESLSSEESGPGAGGGGGSPNSNQNQQRQRPLPSRTAAGGHQGAIGRTNGANNNANVRGGRPNFGSQQADNHGGHQSFEGNSLDESSHQSGFGTGTSIEMPAYSGAPTIKLDWLAEGFNEFKLVDVHFHWGERRDNGSEHAIDGNRSAMEMHLVHMRHGLDKEQVESNSDSLTVISVLIESNKKSNADFNPIVSALNSINKTSQAQEIEYKSINDLLPDSLDKFYTYRGSLTTPPCFQVVNWIVMAKRLLLNAKQIEMFRNLYSTKHARQRPAAGVSPMASASPSSSNEGGFHPGDDSNHDQQHRYHQPRLHDGLTREVAPIMPNIRQIQPLNNRTIMSSFQPSNNQPGWPYSGSSSIKTTIGVGSSLLIWALALVCASSMLHSGQH